MRRTSLAFLCTAGLLLTLLTACGGDEAPIAPVVQQPTSAVTAAVEAVASPTLEATLPPPVVASPPPTAAADPAAETTTATPESENIALLSVEDFGTTYNRLTGEEVADPALLQRRPLVIKISNAPAGWVRPQSGLNEADIVFEHVTEGALTRFTMLIYGKDPERVGPIRSARLIDMELPAMYDAALVFSGASTGVSRKLYSSDFASRLLASGEEGFFRTGEDKPYEHTLYARPDGLRRALTGKGLEQPPNFNQLMTFTSEPPAGGTPATEISLDFRWETVTWTYDADTGYYYRTAAGAPHLDGNTGEQVRARNIVVPYINHVDDASICEEIRNDQCVALSVEVQLWGQGNIVIFRDGQRYDGTWRRENRNDMLTFYDGSGNPIPLQIGNSWFELMSQRYPAPAVTP
ncbi:MAG: DUF3048 domain-containing protein [Ardenticatenaceae bacterium]|nr:DUF3048 domain-containing protein [Ardenticatenaceae bacterium]